MQCLVFRYYNDILISTSYRNRLFAFRNHAESDDVIELTYTVQVPIDTVKNRACRYKYCVISDANEVMKTPFEFIAGSTIGSTVHGDIIDRSLRFLHNKFEEGSKCTYIRRIVEQVICNYA